MSMEDFIEPLKFSIVVDVADYEKKLNQAKILARDNKRVLDPDFKFKLEADIVQLQFQLQKAKEMLKNATNDSAKFTLQLDVNRLSRDITEAKRSLNNYLNTGDTLFSRLQAKFNGLGTAVNGALGFLGFGTALTAITGYLNSSKKASADFVNGMSMINTVVQTSNKELDKLGKNIVLLSDTYGVATKDIQSLVFEIASAGNELQSIPYLTELSLRASIATGESATDIFKGANAVIKAYGDEVGSAGEIVDKFFQANVQGQLTVGELSREIQGVTGSAVTLGVALDEVLAGYTLFTGRIGTSSDVTTGLARLFETLSSPSKQTLDVLEKYGISYGYIQQQLAKSTQEGGGFLNVTKEITDKLEGNNLALGQVFNNVNAYKVATSIDTLETEDFKKAIDGITNSQGRMSEALAEVTEDDGFKLKVATQNRENFKISVGNVVVKVLSFLINLGKSVGIFVEDIAVPLLGILLGSFTKTFEDIIRSSLGFASGLIKVIKGIVDNAIIAGENIGIAFKNGLSAIASFAPGIFNFVLSQVDGFLNKTAKGINLIIGLINNVTGKSFKTLGNINLGSIVGSFSGSENYKEFKDIPGVFDDMNKFKGDNYSQSFIEYSKQAVGKGVDKIKNVNSNTIEQVFQEILAETQKKDQDKLPPGTDDKGKGSGKGKTAEQKAKEELEVQIKSINAEADARIQSLGRTEEERKKNAEKIIEIDKAREEKIKEISGKGADNIVSNTKSAYEKTAKIIKDYYGDINKAIEDSKGKVEDYQKSIDDLNEKISDLTKDKNTSIASRVVEIDKQLLNTDGGLTGEEITKLNAERSLAFQGLSQKESEDLQKLIDEGKTRDGLSEIGKIQYDYAKKKEILDQDLLDLETRKESEKTIYEELTNAKIEFEKKYTNQLTTEINKQVDIIQKYLSKMREAKDLGAITGTGGTIVNNIDNSINNTNQNSNNSQQTNIGTIQNGSMNFPTNGF